MTHCPNDGCRLRSNWDRGIGTFWTCPECGYQYALPEEQPRLDPFKPAPSLWPLCSTFMAQRRVRAGQSWEVC